MGDLGLEVEDFETLTKEIVSVAETHAQGRIVSVLEGGYNVPILAGSVAAHLMPWVPNRVRASTGATSSIAVRDHATRSIGNDPDGI